MGKDIEKLQELITSLEKTKIEEDKKKEVNNTNNTVNETVNNTSNETNIQNVNLNG